MQISVVSADTLDGSDGTPEHGTGEVFNLVSEAAVIGSSIESERKETGGFYSVVVVQDTEQWVSSTNFSSDLRDVTIASEAGRVRVSRGSVLHIVLGCHPGQVAGEFCVDRRVVRILVQLRNLIFI